MPLKRRVLDRDSGVVRDAPLIVIASEDTYAVHHYLTKFRARRVQFRVLPTQDCMSSPQAVLDRLDSYRDREQLNDDDELWLCIDRDHWAEDNHILNLRQVRQKCVQKGYRFAISNPCFDLWILLHFVDPPPEGFRNCGEVTHQLRKLIPGYCKTSVESVVLTVDQVQQAINRAERMAVDDLFSRDTSTTQMHLIMESLRAKEAIRLTIREGLQ